MLDSWIARVGILIRLQLLGCDDDDDDGLAELVVTSKFLDTC